MKEKVVDVIKFTPLADIMNCNHTQEHVECKTLRKILLKNDRIAFTNQEGEEFVYKKYILPYQVYEGGDYQGKTYLNLKYNERILVEDFINCLECGRGIAFQDGKNEIAYLREE